jgi:hypothetical protein
VVAELQSFGETKIYILGAERAGWSHCLGTPVQKKMRDALDLELEKMAAAAIAGDTNGDACRASRTTLASVAGTASWIYEGIDPETSKEIDTETDTATDTEIDTKIDRETGIEPGARRARLHARAVVADIQIVLATVPRTWLAAGIRMTVPVARAMRTTVPGGRCNQIAQRPHTVETTGTVTATQPRAESSATFVPWNSTAIGKATAGTRNAITLKATRKAIAVKIVSATLESDPVQQLRATPQQADGERRARQSPGPEPTMRVRHPLMRRSRRAA